MNYLRSYYFFRNLRITIDQNLSFKGTNNRLQHNFEQKYDQNIVEKEIKKWSKKYITSKVIPISALNKFNIENIKKNIVNLLPFSPPYFEKDAITDKSSRFFVEDTRSRVLFF